MIPRLTQQKLPSSGPAREALREKGQFWTPAWVAEAMVAWCVAGGSDTLFDPAVGGGAFFHAAKAVGQERGRMLRLLGTEIDPEALQQALSSGLSSCDLTGVEIRDFVLQPPSARYQAVVANPPYIRHHRLLQSTKEKLKRFGAELIGESLDGRAGLHIYFLLRAVQLLAPDGRLAFIMPADTCEGIFARTLWRWITTHYCLEAVITFAPDASPFPSVDTNPVIFLIRNAAPKARFHWARCTQAETGDLKTWLDSDFREAPLDHLEIYERETAEGISSGLSRPPAETGNVNMTLSDFARVMRGIATGANEFFFLTRKQAEELNIPETMLLPAVGRTRDVPGEVVTQETLQQLEESGRPTWLFAPDGRDLNLFPDSVREYLLKGLEAGLNQRPLIAQRRPWYRMEARRAPEFLFAYLGRRNARFIRNVASVMPLTGFLCVYPRSNDPAFVEKLWQVLRHPDTVKNLAAVGKSYGSGAIKVEPRALERLPIPDHIIGGADLKPVLQQPTLPGALW
ncbi:MAG TPA: N-6 DNA methylase [Blastocatellia bacterium]|nr:N-6 DNA methylase [Blastocatellia bacterium]